MGASDFFWIAIAGVNVAALIVTWWGYRDTKKNTTYQIKKTQLPASVSSKPQKGNPLAPTSDLSEATPHRSRTDAPDNSDNIIKNLRERLLALKDKSEMNPAHYDKITGGVHTWNKWRNSQPEVTPELKEANLRNTNLQRADLANADLQGADLRGVILSNAILQEAILFFANLQEADLTNANLQRATLFLAKMQEAKLAKADLQGVNLIGAFMQNTDLRLANLQGADLMKADLEGAEMMGANLQNANLARANMKGVKGLAVEQLCEVKSLFGAVLSPEIKKQVSKRNSNLFEVT